MKASGIVKYPLSYLKSFDFLKPTVEEYKLPAVKLPDPHLYQTFLLALVAVPIPPESSAPEHEVFEGG